jgi:hypothetical protein
MYTERSANDNSIQQYVPPTLQKSSLAPKLKHHPERQVLEQLVQGIQETLSHIEDERSLYPDIEVRTIQNMNPIRYQYVLRDQQAINGPHYSITKAYTISVTFSFSNCLRPAYYDCIYYRNGEQYGISFLPHESLLDILGFQS